MSTLASYERTGPVGRLTFNRPEALNAFSGPMLGDALKALAAAKQDRALRVLVVGGAGNHFSAGGDVKAMAAYVASGKQTAYFRGEMLKMNKLVEGLAAFPVPTIAAVKGFAAGGGCSVALACDLRVAERGAKFLQAFVNIGLAPDTGSSFFLTRLLGLGRVMEMVLAGEPVDAETALHWGLVNKVAAPEHFAAEVAALAAKLAAKSPAALKAARGLVLGTAQKNFKAALAAETKTQTALGGGREFPEALHAFLEKRPANF